ncbi:hypothetical protein ILUMI_05766 [Ignelater luminosus]|uniref:Sugar phosphate phosphatase n=1 Tax=Ignelater luminosus TaxID=2038154 RepID=A0A8K0GJT0_IGNLU|nr:hypothetical protein ILUMI_05766 [Ignelater luminosus]
MTSHSFKFILIYCVLLYETKMCQCKADDITIMDMVTPINASLSAFYKRSFAYYTVKDRLPRILTQTIDILVRHKDNIGDEYGKEAKEELKTVIGEMSKLKYEIQTNKTMRNIETDAPDAQFYNEYLAKQTNITYFSAIWLHTECYMYRRLRETFELTTHLKTYDPFRVQKQESFANSSEPMAQLGAYVLKLLNNASETKNTKEEFIKLLKLNLWGNKCDLSFTNGVVEDAGDPFQMLTNLESYILSDDSEKVWEAVSDLGHESQIIDIVVDNAGYEAFTDLCIADFIVSNGLAQSMRLYVKAIPWFVSDLMVFDFNWTLEQLRKSDDDNLRELGARWTDYVKNKVWTVVEDDFFTYPVDYSYMAEVRPKLYKQLSEAKFIIFKGDLNYRKLFGEKNWDPTTPCNVALQGFGPSKLCTLRTVKCHVICGLNGSVANRMERAEPNWMETGNYGLIQYTDKINPLA